MTTIKDVIACAHYQGYKGYISPSSVIRAKTIYNKDLGEWWILNGSLNHIVTDEGVRRWRRSNKIDQIINN